MTAPDSGLLRRLKKADEITKRDDWAKRTRERGADPGVVIHPESRRSLATCQSQGGKKTVFSGLTHPGETYAHALRLLNPELMGETS